MAIFTTRLPAFVTGAAVAVTAINAFTVPSGVAELVAVRGHVHATQGDPAESIFGVFSLGGQDWKNSPYEWFSELGSAKLGAIDEVGYEVEPRWWPAYLPVKSGGTIGVYYEPLDALANNGLAAVDFKWSTVKTGMPPIQRLCSRETATTAAVGPALTITGAARLVELVVGMTNAAVTADDPTMAGFDILSGALKDQQLIQLTSNIHTIEATTGRGLTSLMKAEIDIEIKNDPAIFTCVYTAAVALTAAGQYAYSLGYIPKSVQ